MIYPKPVVRIMGDIASAVQTAVLPTLQLADANITALNYQFGHLKELIETMAQYDKSPAKRYLKYPLIALILDFAENMGNSGGYLGNANLQMIIATSTEPTLKAAERYTKNFEPILYPIYQELINQIELSPGFVTQGLKHIKHVKTDHPYWGSKGLADSAGNVFADYIDAIEVSSLQLTINFKNC